MTDKFKKIEREYVLSDSTVNEYGFRLLTSGYQLAAFQKNPIGYYMHRREEGIVLKWEDLRMDDDKVVGTPVINLSNGRGEQTCSEVENGFLNAASVGHIIVLEYSVDPEMMLPGQTGPTITKWYNKECSLVDIPGNGNALTKLYDAQEHEINLMDLTQHGPPTPEVGFGGRGQAAVKAMCRALKLEQVTDENVIVEAVQNLVAKGERLEVEHMKLLSEKETLEQQLKEAKAQRLQSEITAILDRALEDKKLTVVLRDKLAKDYAANPKGLKSILASMPAYGSIAAQLKSQEQEVEELEWQWDDYEKNDPMGKRLKELRANEPERYKELFDRKFNP